ncbi:hypothetical protein NL676_007988 [Syzygium grande]|nr:hypothetical protein NL676_007988 [Syzygium grande]
MQRDSWRRQISQQRILNPISRRENRGHGGFEKVDNQWHWWWRYSEKRHEPTDPEEGPGEGGYSGGARTLVGLRVHCLDAPVLILHWEDKCHLLMLIVIEAMFF